MSDSQIKTADSVGRTVKFFFNSIAAAINQVVLMACGFIIPKVMLVCYGSELNGLVSSINQFIAHFSLVEAGIANASIYALYRPLACRNYYEINSIVSAARKFYFQSGCIFLLLLNALALIYPFFIKTNALTSLQTTVLVFILGFRGCLEFFTLAKYRVLLTADQKTYVISIMTSFSVVLTTILVSILSAMRFNIVVVYAVSSMAIFVRPAILGLYVRFNYHYIDYAQKPKMGAIDKRWDAFYLQMLGSVQNGAPIILATVFTSLKLVSVYSIFNMIMSGVNGILNVFLSGLSASFGEVIAKCEIKTLQRSYRDFEYAFYATITLIYSVSFVTLMPFVKIFTSGIKDVNYDLPLFGFMVVVNSYLHSLKIPQGMLIVSAGLFKETRIQVTIQLLIIVFIGIISTPIYGLYGIVLASCLSNLYRVIDLLFFVPKYVTKLPVIDSFLRMLWSIATIFVSVLPFCYMEVNVNSLVRWGMFSLLVAFWSLICVVVSSYVLQRSSLVSVFYRLKDIIKQSHRVVLR